MITDDCDKRIFITLYADDIARLMKGENIKLPFEINGKPLEIDYVICKQCQDKVVGAK